MHNVLIVEDKESHREALCKIVSRLNQELKLYAAADVSEAYQIAMECHVHLFLIDIILNPQKLGDVSGLWFAQEMRNVKKYRFTPMIFLTSLEDPKLYAYSQLQCFGYIEKPFDAGQVQKLILKALQFPTEEDEERFVYFRKDGIVYSKCVKEIIFIESRRRKVTIHCVHDVLEIPYKTCEELLQEMDSDSFVRCSRYAIVNKAHIEEIDYVNRYIKLRGIAETVEIGVMMKKQFQEKMKII